MYPPKSLYLQGIVVIKTKWVLWLTAETYWWKKYRRVTAGWAQRHIAYFTGLWDTAGCDESELKKKKWFPISNLYLSSRTQVELPHTIQYPQTLFRFPRNSLFSCLFAASNGSFLLKPILLCVPFSQNLDLRHIQADTFPFVSVPVCIGARIKHTLHNICQYNFLMTQKKQTHKWCHIAFSLNEGLAILNLEPRVVLVPPNPKFRVQGSNPDHAVDHKLGPWKIHPRSNGTRHLYHLYQLRGRLIGWKKHLVVVLSLTYECPLWHRKRLWNFLLKDGLFPFLGC